MPDFEHQRHKTPTELVRPRELLVCCPPLRSNVNLSRILRLAGCAGIEKIIACGNASIDPAIARNAVDFVEVEFRRSLLPVVKRLRQDGYHVVGLEQTTRSENLFHFEFQRRTALVIGHERNGISQKY